jgi:hypothetical protein
MRVGVQCPALADADGEQSVRQPASVGWHEVMTAVARIVVTEWYRPRAGVTAIISGQPAAIDAGQACGHCRPRRPG